MCRFRLVSGDLTRGPQIMHLFDITSGYILNFNKLSKASFGSVCTEFLSIETKETHLFTYRYSSL